jgi:putative ATPase
LADSQSSDNVVTIDNGSVRELIQRNIAIYDKGGEQHYDIASAFIKSIRGSDPHAAVYWLARMIEGGEDIKFIARRLVILSAEDVGLANPNALLMANACASAVQFIGYPEGRIILSQTVIYLAVSPKSNSAYEAINTAQRLVQETGPLNVPLHIRNAPTQLMKQLDYGKDYKYAHSYEGNFVQQEFLPDELSSHVIYQPQQNKHESIYSEKLKRLWQDKYPLK